MSVTAGDLFWTIERISKCHVREHFDCGAVELDEYLRRFARQNDATNIGRTFVAVLPGEREVLGYYTISTGDVEFDSLPVDSRHGLARYPIPVVRLGRLAVTKSLQGRRLGETLLLHALRSAYDMNQRIAISAVVVKAKDQSARNFYEKFGFRELLDEQLHLFLPMSSVAALF